MVLGALVRSVVRWGEYLRVLFVVLFGKKRSDSYNHRSLRIIHSPEEAEKPTTPGVVGSAYETARGIEQAAVSPGLVGSAYEAARGIGQTAVSGVTHPIESARGIGQAAVSGLTHPIETAGGIAQTAVSGVTHPLETLREFGVGRPATEQQQGPTESTIAERGTEEPPSTTQEEEHPETEEFQEAAMEQPQEPAATTEPTQTTEPTKETVERHDSAYRTDSTRSEPKAKALYDTSATRGREIVPVDEMTQDRREELVLVLQRMMAKAPANPEYRDAFLYMIGLLRQVERGAARLGRTEKEEILDANIWQAQRNLKVCVALF